MINDEELLERAKGDANAESDLLEKYKPLVVKIARSYFILGGEMEDIVQEGMIGLYKAVKNYNPNKNASFKTFAITCIKHQIQSAIKNANAKKNAPLTNSVPLQSFSESDEDEFLPVNLIFQLSPDEKVINDERYQKLVAKIKSTLTARDYEILSLYLKGYTYKEISKFLSLSEKNIDNSLSRIKAKIRAIRKEEWMLFADN